MSKVKEWLKTKPKGNFWMWAFFTLLLFRFVTPYSLTYLQIFQVGLVSPDLDMTVKFDNISNQVTEQLVNPFRVLFESGQRIAQQNRTTARILFYVISGFVYSIWASMIGLCFQLIRFGISKLTRLD